jgi:uncharacterized protein YggE
MLKTTLLALTLGLALNAPAARAAQLPDYPFVHVTGSAFTAVLPDIASLDFEIVAVDADPAAGRAVLEARVAEVKALMQQLGLDPEDANVREVRQSLRQGEQSQGGPTAGAPLYELRCDVHINVRNITSWPALAGGLLGKPNLDGFATAFDTSTMESINDELVTQAILDARRRAEVIAAASGRRLGAVTAVTPDALKNLGTAMGLERDEFRVERNSGRGGDKLQTQEADRAQLLTIPALKLRQPVDVIFRLENAASARKPSNRSRN